MKLLNSLCFAFALLAVPACGGDDTGGVDNNLPSCEEDDRDETYVAGIAKLGDSAYTVSLMDANPAPPTKGQNTWTIEVTDPDGSTASGLGIEMVGYMPDHGHGTLGTPSVTDGGDGAYTVGPVNLFMPGYWEVSITLFDPGETASSDDDVDLDTMTFKFCIEG